MTLKFFFVMTLSSALLQPASDFEAVDQAAFQKLCSEIIQQHGGSITTCVGDEVLTCFGYPVAHEEDSEQAISAGLKLSAALPGELRRRFVSLDLGSLEERNWQIDSTLQLGLLVPSGTRRWRAGLGYHEGSVPLGEFFQVDESYISFGLWLDP